MLSDIKCVTVSYGRVRGKAKNYPYFEPAVYFAKRTKDGIVKWVLDYSCGGARRSARLAEQDARAIAAEKNIPFIFGVRQYHPVAEQYMVRVSREQIIDKFTKVAA